MPKESQTLLGLFPNIDSECIGGIQESGRLAWAAIIESLQEHDIQPQLFSYKTPESDRSDVVFPTAVVGSRARAILATFGIRRNPESVLIWQLGLLKLLPFFRAPKKVTLFLHGIEAWREQDWLTRRLLKRPDLFLTNSNYTWRRFLSHNPSLDQANHQTVELGMKSPISLREIPAPTRPQALMLSRLSKTEDYKGHREVIAAWPLVLSNHPNAELVIAGDGDLRPELEKLSASVGVGSSVKFPGRVSEETKERLLEESRCLLMPSRGEGFGLVYLEAMRVGRPCLVSTIDAGREVVNPPEAGLAVDLDQQIELAEAISGLMSDGHEWRRWSEQARHRYEQNYTAKHFQERLTAALFPTAEDEDALSNHLRTDSANLVMS